MCIGTSVAHLLETFKKKLRKTYKAPSNINKNESKLKDTKWKKKTLFTKSFAIVFALLLQYHV